MGVGAYACYKLTTLFPGVNIIVWILVLGLLLGRHRRRLRPAEPAHQGLLPGGRDARRAVLPAMVLRAHPLALQLQRLGRDRGAGAHRCSASPVTGATATPEVRYLVLLSIVVVLAWLASNLVHGRIGRSWMAVRDMDIAAELMGIKPAADQAPRLRRVVLLLRRRRAPA
jgi:branched-chain amino acid transport system permease protein